MREELLTTRESLSEVKASRDEATEAAASANARLQTSEEQLLRSRREHDLLQAERSVWQVARSGIQEELAKVGCGGASLSLSLSLSFSFIHRSTPHTTYLWFCASRHRGATLCQSRSGSCILHR